MFLQWCRTCVSSNEQWKGYQLPTHLVSNQGLSWHHLRPRCNGIDLGNVDCPQDAAVKHHISSSSHSDNCTRLSGTAISFSKALITHEREEESSFKEPHLADQLRMSGFCFIWCTQLGTSLRFLIKPDDQNWLLSKILPAGWYDHSIGFSKALATMGTERQSSRTDDPLPLVPPSEDRTWDPHTGTRFRSSSDLSLVDFLGLVEQGQSVESKYQGNAMGRALWLKGVMLASVLSISMGQTLSEECTGYLPEDCREYGDCKTCWDGSRLDCFPSESSQLYGENLLYIIRVYVMSLFRLGVGWDGFGTKLFKVSLTFLCSEAMWSCWTCLGTLHLCVLDITTDQCSHIAYKLYGQSSWYVT